MIDMNNVIVFCILALITFYIIWKLNKKTKEKINSSDPIAPNAGFAPLGSFFIKVKDKENLYLHPLMQVVGHDEYIVREGVEFAAIWTKQNGHNFILEEGSGRLELVSVEDAIFRKQDKTK